MSISPSFGKRLCRALRHPWRAVTWRLRRIKGRGVITPHSSPLVGSGRAHGESQRPAQSGDNSSTPRARGHAAYRRGDYGLAAEAFREAISIEPKDARLRYLSARTVRRLGSEDEALDEARRALSLRPGWGVAVLFAGRMLASRGRLEEVAHLLPTVTDLDELDSGSLGSLSNLVFRSRSAPAAHIVAAELRRRDRIHEARSLEAAGYWLRGEHTVARDAIKRLVALPEASAREAAVRFFVLAEDASAVKAFVASGGEVAPTLVAPAARLLRNAGELRAALELIDGAPPSAPDHPRAGVLREVIASELRIIEGRWRPPGIGKRLLKGRSGILHLVGKSLPYARSGYTLRTHHTVQAQRVAGLDARVVSQAGFPWRFGIREAPNPERVDEVTYLRLGSPYQTQWNSEDVLDESIKGSTALIERVRPAVLHPASDYMNALWGLELRRAFDIPVVYEVRGFWEETWRSRRPKGAESTDRYLGRRATELRCMDSADRIVTLAEVMKTELVSRGVSESKVVIVPNAVDTDRFVGIERDPGLAARLGLDGNDTVAGYVSNFVSYEGIAYLLQAIRELVDRGHRIRGLLVGDGPERASLEHLAGELGIRDRVVFPGWVAHEQVPAYYALLDVFVTPRTSDVVSQLVTPLKPFEAMASGKPLIVSRVPALSEIVAEGHTGLAFEPENAADLADKIEALVQDAALGRRLASAALDWVRENRSWTANARRYTSLYSELGVPDRLPRTRF